MSATDELRRLLDERGVEYKRHYLNTLWHAGTKLYMATDDTDGTLTVDNITPEQAIAATLGEKRTCETCNELGNVDSFINHLIQAERAERTCKFVNSKGSDYPPVCSACGYELGIYDCEWFEDGTYGYERNYCPNCGAKVVKK